MFDQLKQIASIGDTYVKGKIRGVVVLFHGTGYMQDEIIDLELAAHGAFCVVPYSGLWSWTTTSSITMMNEIIRRTYEEYNLAEDIPLIFTGGSRGGHAALALAAYSKKTPAAVSCNCPVTDMKYHYTERPDLPREFLTDYGLSGRPMDEVLNEISPMALVKNMPRIPYQIIHGTNDTAVNKAAHSDKFVQKMREAGHDIEYIEAEGMGHCLFDDFTVYRNYVNFLLRFIPASKK